MKLVTLTLILLTGIFSSLAAQDIEVINMIPAGLSGESNQDSEPDLTFNPNNPSEIIATAFTPNPTGSLTSAPIYISQDGGITWVLNNIVPSSNGMTGDITVALSRNNVLYSGILFGGGGLSMRILRSSTYTAAGVMEQLMARSNEDQPYARTFTPLGGPNRNLDQLFVGHNDFGNTPASASLEQSNDAATAPPPAGLSVVRVERRTPFGQNGPPIRPAVHPNGTVYAVYTQRTSTSGVDRIGHIVVVRDDDWGQGANPYSDITDPGDGAAGVIVANNVTWVFNNSSVFGQERLGDKATIAVDANDSRIVYVGWIDRPAPATGNNATVHVRRSIDGGVNWSTDLLTVPGAISPQLAVNVQGVVGVVYQQLTTGGTPRWQTHFRQSSDGGVNWSDSTLVDAPANTPTVSFLPYLGDYIGLTADGKDFLGVFSASNFPDNANFPGGVTFQRAADFGTNTLTDGVGNSVGVSIDPYFFRARNLARNLDFYVRDWTDSPSTNDIGLEPSTHPVFYNSSDVWNRRSNSAGGFTVNDNPVSEDPQPASGGNNFAFARVHRKEAGTPASVNLHFLKSEFGTGSNYESANVTSDPTLTFAAGDLVQTMSTGYEWTLNAETSSHVCLAIEVSTPQDQFAAPSLLGRAPGWPNTDLSVIYDNNKAQRNLGVFAGAGEGGRLTLWALIHNAASYRRDVVLRVDPDRAFEQAFGKLQLIVVNGEHRFDGKQVVLPSMSPCDYRWIGLDLAMSSDLAEGQQCMVNFTEIEKNIETNGFTMAVVRSNLEIAAAESLSLLAANIGRIADSFKLSAAKELAAELSRDFGPFSSSGKIPSEDYLKIVRKVNERYAKLLREIISEANADAFGVSGKLDRLREIIGSADGNRIWPAQTDLDQTVDVFITHHEKQKGTVADVAQNMRWQAHLIRTLNLGRRIPGVVKLAESSDEFERGYSMRKYSAKDYSTVLRQGIPLLRKINDALVLSQSSTLAALEDSNSDVRSAQKLHCAFLRALENSNHDDQISEAPLVVVGTVSAVGHSKLTQLPANESTYVISVDRVLAANKSLSIGTGTELTLVSPKTKLEMGKNYLIYATPSIIGKSIGVELIKATEASLMTDVTAAQFAQAQQDEQLRKRLRHSDVVVSGKVAEIRPIKSDARIESEHFPDFHLAVLQVDKTYKGDFQGKELIFVWAKSMDVHWFRAPKFKGGESGIFLLKMGPEGLNIEAAIDASQFTLLGPQDFRPDEESDAIERLLR